MECAPGDMPLIHIWAVSLIYAHISLAHANFIVLYDASLSWNGYNLMLTPTY